MAYSSDGNVNATSHAEALSCFQLIYTNLQSSNLDYVYIRKLYDEVENILQALTSTTEDQLHLASLDSLLDTVSLHRNLLKSLTNENTKPRNTEICSERAGGSGSGHQKDRHAAIESMKTKFIPGQMGCELDAVVGVKHAKDVLKEACIFPLRFPHLFKGAVRPWRRILLYGPPGTGKTLLAKSLAQDLRCDTYVVSSAALLSSWIGESEKLIRELFETAKKNSEKSLIFFDEVDSMCRQRSHAEDEHSRRVKTELLRQLEGISSSSDAEKEPLILAATNCPWDIDPAFLRRFQRRIYVALPTRDERKLILETLLRETSVNLSAHFWERILDLTQGFSGADLTHLVSAVVMIPIRELHNNKYWIITEDGNVAPSKQGSFGAFHQAWDETPNISTEMLTARPVQLKDFETALQSTSKTVTWQVLKQYEDFNKSYH